MTDEPTNGGAKPQTKTRAQERAEAVKTPSRLELAERIESLERELAETRAKAEEHLYNWQRSAADFSNYKRRTDEERATATRFSTAMLIGKLLAVLDDFDRALENVPPDARDPWIEGVQLVERKLRGVLESEGVTPIEALGQPFDPNLHEAVAHEETTEHADNEVIGEVQRGYRLHDRVLRPSLVRVANNPKEQ
ncbi:MAG TPA: nucleotide exchange factor GrpE [Candidatus Limnocylindrales bacterium]|jgi:molecular chaperone GrpE|nr:nucleotide exchange factor GrpE [Candidatus Limnocylindrales bacterium]